MDCAYYPKKLDFRSIGNMDVSTDICPDGLYKRGMKSGPSPEICKARRGQLVDRVTSGGKLRPASFAADHNTGWGILCYASVEGAASAVIKEPHRIALLNVPPDSIQGVDLYRRLFFGGLSQSEIGKTRTNGIARCRTDQAQWIAGV